MTHAHAFEQVADDAHRCRVCGVRRCPTCLGAGVDVRDWKRAEHDAYVPPCGECGGSGEL